MFCCSKGYMLPSVTLSKLFPECRQLLLRAMHINAVSAHNTFSSPTHDNAMNSKLQSISVNRAFKLLPETAYHLFSTIKTIFPILSPVCMNFCAASASLKRKVCPTCGSFQGQAIISSKILVISSTLSHSHIKLKPMTLLFADIISIGSIYNE